MHKTESTPEFDLYSLSNKYPVARAVAALAMVAALLAPTPEVTSEFKTIAATDMMQLAQNEG